MDIWTQDNIAPGSSAYMTYTPAGTGAVTTTVQAKLRESVSVKDFGAVGDGVTDDTAAIQACIDAAHVARTLRVYFPSGKYIASTITLYAGMTIYGDNQGSFGLGTSDTTNGYGSTYWATVLQQKVGTNAHFIRFIPLADDPTFDYIGQCTISDMCIVGDSSATSGDGIRFQGASNFGYADNTASPRPTITYVIYLQNLLIRNFKGNGIWLPCPRGAYVTNVYSGFNGGAGLFLDSGSGGVNGFHADNFSGDANLADQLVVYSLGSTFPTSDGLNSNVVVTNLVAEQRVNTCAFAASAVGNNHAIRFDTCNSGVVTINGLSHYSVVAGAGGNVGDTIYLENQTANFAPSIAGIGVVNTCKFGIGQTAAGNILNDTVNSKTIPAPQAVISYGLYYPVISVNSVSTAKPWIVAGQGSANAAAVPSGGFQSIGTTPAFIFWETDQAANAKGWAWITSGGILTLRLLNDAGGSVTTAIAITRSGTAVSLIEILEPVQIGTVNFSATALGIYANEAAAVAAGLPSGRIYKTATGELRIKL